MAAMERSAYLAQALQEMGQPMQQPTQGVDLQALARMMIDPNATMGPGEVAPLMKRLGQAGQNVRGAPQRFGRGLQGAGQNLRGLFGMGAAAQGGRMGPEMQGLY